MKTSTPIIDPMIDIMKTLRTICEPLWCQKYEQFLQRDTGYYPDGDVRLVLFTYRFSEPIIEICYDTVVMNLSFYKDDIEMSFWVSKHDVPFENDIRIQRNITEEQLFQLSLVHDIHWITFEMVELMIEFERLFYEHFPRPHTLDRWVHERN